MAEKKYEPQYLCWAEKDFMADRQVMRMTPHQRLMYRALCQTGMFCDSRPYLPTDDNELYLLADADSLEQWQANRATVLAKFYLVEVDGQQVLAHKRMLSDWQKHLDHIERKRVAGVASSQARAQRQSTRVEHDPTNEIKVNEIKVNGAVSAKRAHQLPEDFVPNDNNREVAAELSVNLQEALRAFKDFHNSKGSSYRNWHLALNTWLRRERLFAGGKKKSEAPQYGDLTENYAAQRERLKLL